MIYILLMNQTKSREMCTRLLTRDFGGPLHDPLWRCNWQGNIDWPELLKPFASVKNLYLSSDIARCIVPAPQELVGVGARATEVLPTIQNVFLEELQPSGPVEEGIQQIVSVRQVAGHPIAVSYGQKVRY